MPKVDTPKPSHIYLGIDPGKSGGIAWIFRSRTTAISMPSTERDIWDVLEGMESLSSRAIAVIEKVGGYTGEGQPGSAMFNFGWGYGGLRMALIAANIPFEEVTPQKWQKAMGISGRKKTESKTQWKNRLKAKAQQLFPELKVTLSTCDALLIAEYARRKTEGRL